MTRHIVTDVVKLNTSKRTLKFSYFSYLLIAIEEKLAKSFAAKQISEQKMTVKDSSKIPLLKME
jgi:hypothetical protein